MLMKKIICLTALIMFLSLPAFADPFSDVPQGHWSYDAVQILEEKGLVEGYPDGLFKGDRPMTRYEMAMVVARVVAKLEQVQASIPEMPDLSIYATKEDMETINKLLAEYKGELNALGVRVGNIEETVGKLSERISEKERIKINGLFYTTAQSIGYAPGVNNTSSFGNPNTGAAFGPAIKNANDPYMKLPLFQGFENSSKMRLFITAVFSATDFAGGELTAFSAFGDKGIRDISIAPSYNSLGSYIDGNFRANMSSLWFHHAGEDINLKGTFGDYDFTKNKTSNKLFQPAMTPYGFDLAILCPLNGINLQGKIYNTVDVEAYMGRNINSFANFNYPASGALKDSLYYYGTADYLQTAPSWYPLATPYNNGAGSYHVYSYDRNAAGQYDNYVYGMWAGYDFNEGKGHFEGAYVRIFEDSASNPGIATSIVAPKGTVSFGFKGHYKLLDDKLKVYGEFNQSRFDYNFTSKNHNTSAGNFFEVGAVYEFPSLKLDGKFIWVDANYNPIGYYNQLQVDYLDTHHHGWYPWKEGSNYFQPFFSNYMPNRKGVNLSADWTLGSNKEGLIYGDFTWQNQVNPTMITNDQNSFQKNDFLTGSIVPGVIGANIYGNQDVIFTVNDPSRGSQTFVKVGGKYTLDNKWHMWASFNRYHFARDLQSRVFNGELNLNFVYTGVTYDLTDTFSVQGNFAYVKQSGNLQIDANVIGIDRNVSFIDNNALVPGAGIMWQTGQNQALTVDYKYYKFTDNVLSGTEALSGRNDYNANRVMMRYMINF